MAEQLQRPQFTQKNLDTAVDDITEMMEKRLIQKGKGIYLSSHEALGILTEECVELIDAIRANDAKQIKKELIDISVACVFGIASLHTGQMHWC